MSQADLSEKESEEKEKTEVQETQNSPEKAEAEKTEESQETEGNQEALSAEEIQRLRPSLNSAHRLIDQDHFGVFSGVFALSAHSSVVLEKLSCKAGEAQRKELVEISGTYALVQLFVELIGILLRHNDALLPALRGEFLYPLSHKGGLSAAGRTYNKLYHNTLL